jgi:hypothetical protein
VPIALWAAFARYSSLLFLLVWRILAEAPIEKHIAESLIPCAKFWYVLKLAGTTQTNVLHGTLKDQEHTVRGRPPALLNRVQLGR